MGRITIETDVVRENNQTYRLGWTEKTKAGTGAAMPVPLSITSVDFPEGTNIRMEVFK
jgi:hypothetical protein